MENALHLEVHYYLKNGLHSMDALVRNRCEAEFLGAVAYIAQSLGAELRFEATAPTEGGFRDIWSVLFSKDNRAVSVPTATTILSLLITQAVAIWNAPPKPDKELERQQIEINRLAIEHSRLENQRSALEVKKLQRELDAALSASSPLTASSPTVVAPAQSSNDVPLPPAKAGGILPATRAESVSNHLSLQTDPKVNKRRSTFYKQLLTYDRVTAVGYRWLPDDQTPTEEHIVPRSEFTSFMLQTDLLEPEVTEAVVEIVSPVITEGDMRWKGRWNGQAISFAMGDKAFKDGVFHKQVAFQHGDSIRCVLETERKLDEGGNPKVSGYRVLTVLEKIDGGGKVYEMPQGRRKRFNDKYAGGQADLFKGNDA